MGGRRKAPSGKGGKAKLWTGGPQPTTSLPCKSREGQPRRPWTPSLQRPPFTPPQPASVTVSILQTGLLRLQSWVPGLLPALGLWPVSTSGRSWPFLHGARCLTHAGGQSSRALCSPSRPWRCHTPRQDAPQMQHSALSCSSLTPRLGLWLRCPPLSGRAAAHAQAQPLQLLPAGAQV